MTTLCLHPVYRAVTLVVTAFLFAVTAPDAEAAPRRGQPAPAFKLFAINGQPLSNEGLKGSVVIIDFWATWCPPCRESLPFFNELHRKYSKQGLQIIGMNVDEGPERELKNFVAEKGLLYAIAMAPRKLQDEFGVRALPVLYILDRNGVVREQVVGFSAQAGKVIETNVKKLLAE
ncbi:MAG: TlpA family protein disulfide reductase [Geobacter sp.]|jgi:thiol-disulfide isomerase/thioredoxin|nr:TlpA family protein disulfide reductase [Geobacter sp.]